MQEPLFPTDFVEIRTTIALESETLTDVARREGFGHDVVVNSNKSVDPWLSGSGTEIILLGKFIVPCGARTGLTINLAELRLCHITERDVQSCQVGVYTVGIGREGRAKPEGGFHPNVKPHWGGFRNGCVKRTRVCRRSCCQRRRTLSVLSGGVYLHLAMAFMVPTNRLVSAGARAQVVYGCTRTTLSCCILRSKPVHR